MIGLAFIFALVIRIQWYIVPSMNAFGTGNWDMTGGSDPWYMKRVVDYILANNAHLVFDADRAYPLEELTQDRLYLLGQLLSLQ